MIIEQLPSKEPRPTANFHAGQVYRDMRSHDLFLCVEVNRVFPLTLYNLQTGKEIYLDYLHFYHVPGVKAVVP